MSAGDALARLTAALEDAGCQVRGGSAQCPAHDDRQASLSIGQGTKTAGAVIKCHVGCTTDEILEKLGMSAADLFDDPPADGSPDGPAYTVAATYTYTDADGRVAFYVERRIPKRFLQYRMVDGERVWKLDPRAARPLYRLPRVLAAVRKGEPVYVVEGEKDVHAVEAAGAVATCNPMGAGKGKWRKEHTDALAGGDVIVVADLDADEAGRRHAARIAAALKGRAASVRVVEPAKGKDAYDHLGAGYGLGEFADARPEPEPAAGGGGQDRPRGWGELTELGYAYRFAAAHAGEFRYVVPWRRWLVWDGQRWAADTGAVRRAAKADARQVTIAALDVGGADLAAARRNERYSAVEAALAHAGTEPQFATVPADLDADPFLLNCANGTLDLRTMERRGHDPADLLTKATRAAWRPDAASGDWDKFLADVQPDDDMRDYLARVTGLALAGRGGEHLLPVHYGAGANGKTTFTEAVCYALGDYAGPADPDLLTARSFDAHPTGTADLFGMRLAVLHETGSGRRLDEARVKRLTGGDEIKAHRMREDFWSFRPSHTFAMLTNHKPVIGGTDEGIWRRLRLVPWTVQIPPGKQDGELGDRLQLAADAILRWLVDGYADWVKNGLGDPDGVTDATAQWRGESDALARFIEQRCVISGGAQVRSSELFAAWQKWAAAEGVEPMTQTAFSLALARKYVKRDRNIGAVWEGIGLQAVAEDGAEDGGG